MSIRQVFTLILSGGFIVIAATALLSMGGLVTPALEQTTFSCILNETQNVVCEREVSLFGRASEPERLMVRAATVDEVCDTDGTSCRYPVMLQTDQGIRQLTTIDPATQSLSNEIAENLNEMNAGNRAEPIDYVLGPHWYLVFYYGLFGLLGLGMVLTAAFGLFNRLRGGA